MFVKGITVGNVKKYIEENFFEQYELWLDSLPQESQEIFKNTIYVDRLYSIKEAIIYPTEITGKLFFDGNIQLAAYEMGFDSANKALKSIYKIFLRISSLNFIIKKARSLYNSFYSGGEVVVVKKTSEKLVLSLSEIPTDEELNITRISGWIDGFLTHIGNKPAKVKFKNVEKNDFIVAEISIFWNSAQNY